MHAVFSSSTFLSILAIVVFCDIRLTRRSFLPPPQIAHPGCRDHVTRTPHRETRRTWQRRERAQSNLSYLARILTFWSSLRCPICKPTSADARHAAWPLTESLAGARRRHVHAATRQNPTIVLLTCHAHASMPRLAAADATVGSVSSPRRRRRVPAHAYHVAYHHRISPCTGDEAPQWLPVLLASGCTPHFVMGDVSLFDATASMVPATASLNGDQIGPPVDGPCDEVASLTVCASL